MATQTEFLKPEEKAVPATVTVHVVLDRSGSMETVRDDTIGAFNAYVSKLAEDAPDSSLSLTIFDSQSIDTVINNEPIGKVANLTRETFVPRGGTPLYDAVGKVVAMLDAAIGKNKALVILTDGQENASHEFTKEAVKKMLDDRQERKNWLVIYLGANQDAFAEGYKFGTQQGTTMSYNTANMSATMDAAAASTARFAASGSRRQASFTTDERDAAVSPRKPGLDRAKRK